MQKVDKFANVARICTTVSNTSEIDEALLSRRVTPSQGNTHVARLASDLRGVSREFFKTFGHADTRTVKPQGATDAQTTLSHLRSVALKDRQVQLLQGCLLYRRH